VSFIKELGTVAFDIEIMSRTIGMGALVRREDGSVWIDPLIDPGIIQLGPWLLIVPEKYRPVAGACAEVVSSRYLRECATPSILRSFICELQTECLREIRMGTSGRLSQMRFWTDLPLEDWIYILETPHHKHPWCVVVGGGTRAVFTTRKEAEALRDRLLTAFAESDDPNQ